MQVLLKKYLFDWMGSHKVSLALIVAVWISLSPSYNNYLSLISKVEAHEKQLSKLDVIDSKLNAIMIELGINKYRIESIERKSNEKPKGE